ncbi:transposase [Thiothrix eikelboomii]|uniref:transposase n=1 Tax=Thiothrix eikelboomii TaxID=92487 RepID=UPI003BB1A24E
MVDSGKLRFIVIDGSTVQEPGATGTTYRLHIAIDLINLSLHQVEVTTDKEGENLDHYTLAAGDVVLIDRGYNQPKTLVPFIDRGGDVVLRYNAHSMNLYEDGEGEDAGCMVKIDWHTRLRKLGKRPSCVPVWLCHGNKRIQGYLHAIPLPEEKAAQARRKARQPAKDKGRNPSVETLSLSEWVLIFTSLPHEVLCTTTASALYRVRWQVELVIKRLKSLLNVDELRAHQGSKLAELYLHGKLLYAAVLEKMTQSRFAHAKRKLDNPSQLTDWRLWKTVADDLKAGIKACFPVDACFADDNIKSLSERPRKQTLQCLPSPILALLNQCREMGMSRV